jgi:nucleoside 2-deoxyribosyltransferase
MNDLMKIYFAGSICSGRQDSKIYREIISYLKQYGLVLTEHFGDDDVLLDMGGRFSDREIHDKDMAWLLESDVIVAEATIKSLGVGYEIGRAIEHHKKILCLYRPTVNLRMSAMIAGAPGIVLAPYDTLDEAKSHIHKFFSKIK